MISRLSAIAGERRAARRYHISLDLRWSLVRRRKVLESGTGRTLDLSSLGLLFEAGRQLPAGVGVELSIAWPALLHNTAPMQLVVAGRIVRSDGSRIAVRMSQHEFRTVSLDQHQRTGQLRGGPGPYRLEGAKLGTVS